MSELPVITIDGPSGVGKGTLSKALAEKLQWHLLDSGAIYRALAVAAINHQSDLCSENEIAQLAENLNLCFQTTPHGINVILDEKNITEALRAENTGNVASQLAVFPKVRSALLTRQRQFLQPPGLIADGRDMGTIVFPEAAVKIFLDASAEERALRRVRQLQAKEIPVKIGNVLLEIRERDKRDRNRTVAPLRPASDAMVIDSTYLSIDQVIEKALDYINCVLPLQAT